MNHLLATLLIVWSVPPAMLPAEQPVAGPRPLLQSLPEKGAWVSYFVTIRADGNESQPTWKAASVGSKDVDGKPHRWLELSASNDGAVFVVYKALIPETAFGAGKNPLDAAVELWVRQGSGEARRIKTMQETDPHMALVLSGPVNGVRKLDETETVRWQKGNLECEVWFGRNALDVGIGKIENTQRVLRHADVPFGVAGARIEMKSGDREAKVEFSLTGMGDGAKSLLPEIK